MKCYLDVAQLLGEMIASLATHDDCDAADYGERAKAVVTALADELAARERLWAALAKLSGAAAFAVGLVDQSSGGNEAVGCDQAERAQDMYDKATDLAGVVALKGE